MLDKHLTTRRVLRIVGGIVIAIIVCKINWGLDVGLYDFLFKLKGKSAPNPEIALIAVEDETLKELDELWPIKTEHFIDLLRTVCEQKPSVLGFDIEFDYQMGTKAQYSQMADIIKDTDCKVLWGRGLVEDTLALRDVPRELPDSEVQIFNNFKLDGVNPKLHEKYVRRVTPYFFNDKQMIKTLAFSASEIHSGEDMVGGDKQWYEFMTDYAGPEGTYRVIPMIDVLREKREKDLFKGKIVFIGRGEKNNFSNYRRTPFYSGENTGMLRLEIHANIADTILSGKMINKGVKERWTIYKYNKYAYALTLILSVFTVWVLFGTTPLVGIIIVIGQIIILLGVGLVSLKMRTYISMIYPLLGIFISYYLLIPYRLVNEYRRRWEFEQANKLLSQVEKMKSNFLSLVTHDLKTPIARIQGLGESILREEGEKLDEKQKTPIKAIIKNSESLNDFISRILSLSRIETSEIKLNLASRDINALIEETIEKFSYILQEKDMKVERDFEPLFSFKMDDQLIGQVIYNIMDNAIKYSDAGSAVRIKTWEEDNRVKVSIKDEGIGINPEDLKNMFTKFYRVKNAKKEEVKGSGLGLYLVKYFVELHGGKISVVSEPSKGSTFTFSLPMK